VLIRERLYDREAMKIRQQDKYSGIDGYGPVYAKVFSAELIFTTYGGAYDNYKYSDTKAKVDFQIFEPLSFLDAQYESGDWINGISESGGFACLL